MLASKRLRFFPRLSLCVTGESRRAWIQFFPPRLLPSQALVTGLILRSSRTCSTVCLRVAKSLSRRCWVRRSPTSVEWSTSFNSTDLETQRQRMHREESIESFIADRPMGIDSLVADRGLDCCCEVEVRLFLRFRQWLILPP